MPLQVHHSWIVLAKSTRYKNQSLVVSWRGKGARHRSQHRYCGELYWVAGLDSRRLAVVVHVSISDAPCPLVVPFSRLLNGAEDDTVCATAVHCLHA